MPSDFDDVFQIIIIGFITNIIIVKRHFVKRQIENYPIQYVFAARSIQERNGNSATVLRGALFGWIKNAKHLWTAGRAGKDRLRTKIE